MPRKHDPTEYRKHELTLERDAERFIRAANEDPRDSCGDQSAALDVVVDVMTDWFTDLWYLMREDGTNLKRISECLVLCARTVEEVEEYAHEDMFTDACFPFNIIDEEDDDDIYDESTGIEDHIAWTYRELSIVAEVRSRSEWIAIDADIQSLGLRGKVKATIRPQDESAGLHSGAREYWDAHWDKAMAKAAIRILGLYAGEVSMDDEDEDGFDSDE